MHSLVSLAHSFKFLECIRILGVVHAIHGFVVFVLDSYSIFGKIDRMIRGSLTCISWGRTRVQNSSTRVKFLFLDFYQIFLFQDSQFYILQANHNFMDAGYDSREWLIWFDRQKVQA